MTYNYELTNQMKKKLEKEIKNFNKQATLNKLNIESTNNDTNAYLEYSQQDKESKFANPDTLEYNNSNTIWGVGFKPELAELFIEKFSKDGSFPILSKKENLVLSSYIMTGSVAYVAEKLHISRSSCNTYLARIQLKFKRLLPLLNY